MLDVIVVGGGHAGIEAALIAARLGCETALISLSLENIGKMPCNPSVGGPAKGIVVREIDALGGQMGITADQTALQFKMLNTTKGPGVQSLRVQSDKVAYAKRMQEEIQKQEHLQLILGLCTGITVDEGKVTGIRMEGGQQLQAKAVILTTGTYMSSSVMISSEVTPSGPDGEPTTNQLSESLREAGLRTFRLKTGTPPRVLTASIDFSKTTPQPGTDQFVAFSTTTAQIREFEKQKLCYLTYTTSKTHELILANLKKSSMYSGVVKGVGPRYCPSIEDKLVRFADKPRHQIFLEPESESLDTTYIQGFSTSLPRDLQEQMVHSLPGLEQAVIEKYAYAIEYDAVDPLQLKPSLEILTIENLFTAGQINGTSGYEEAAAQGLMAGINAVLKLRNQPPLVLRRDEAYIGVMIDDLVTKGTQEPYRLLTSRAEFRLLLRHDNADQRLMHYGYQLGSISEERWQDYQHRRTLVDDLKTRLKACRLTPKSPIQSALEAAGYPALSEGISAEELIRRPHMTISALQPALDFDVDATAAAQTEIELKYEGYITKARKEAEKMMAMDHVILPQNLDYDQVQHLSLEGRQKLKAIQPHTLGQASRISGVSPADIAMLAMVLEQRHRKEQIQ
ncbi:tRNA uridine-5-carboxymethylaminomethyl(34) synthesis enzyme MnmG [Holdemania massiliensis]|uniref:tRNA uridine 5-carboxymethylaminomethyl modification enzyme MnmG n=1 Tax=Holdemania massiliensis TaxID=1468449 RepID=A0A6N7SAW9_9FIRM|nr:tRNA uridine-5-carboxymethylaminomethyl(34) synthesis enzyme MnmG [Holdemania massiliensis]MSA72722.1 tRNA uridine-5-carboxymethylaminomethyl(34) synthesis enzyme MnmG [Holdemania massiliensis]MSA90987.1 tRNA uridine-5-carboxymethylaminomethyl(34) synthesis enzyme MnmG [Holdemania massiliensis]MSB79837.1 tRNA uridine-5-carboxymethylaminomethyl(34) synthesis enzyme MnmG [Holdemania massiliensis]MSC34758.1 tRNA uridine-5-carboxymethylaminomethyl(34) synthesis enzyme MnmG [Holdemania massiliens